MKQIIPFTKDITFKTSISELISISLDDDLVVGDNSVKGNFYIKGSYKVSKTSVGYENYSYKIPCEIELSDLYNLDNSKVSIEDFNYEVSNDTLKVSISVLIDNIEEKEIEDLNDKVVLIDDEEERCIEDEDNMSDGKIIDKVINDKNEVNNINNLNIFDFNNNETYLTYVVYTYQDGDSIDAILNKYNVSKVDLLDYNDLDNIEVGSKIIIPSSNE